MTADRKEGSTSACKRCGKMVRWVRTVTGEWIDVEPVHTTVMVPAYSGEPYHNVQRVRAPVPHGDVCGNG